MAEGGEETDLIADLVLKPFSRRAFQEKLDIKDKGFVCYFQSMNYELYPWFTGSKEHCKLYSWECLLFATDRHGVWSHTGFVNVTCLSKAATRDQSTARHLRATVLSKTFGETRVDLQLIEQVRRETELHNKQVKKNREILKTLIDCVIFIFFENTLTSYYQSDCTVGPTWCMNSHKIVIERWIHSDKDYLRPMCEMHGLPLSEYIGRSRYCLESLTPELCFMHCGAWPHMRMDPCFLFGFLFPQQHSS